MASQKRGYHAKQRLLALRHFKILCYTGVFLGGLSFLLHIVAITTDPWLVVKGIIPVVHHVHAEGQMGNASTNIGLSANINVIKAEKRDVSLSGLWSVCHRNPILDWDWTCIKALQLIEQLQGDKLTYFQSLVAFELISSVATLTGCLVALAAMVQEQPLAVLVAGFTMFFSGMFMLVGHLMMLYQHRFEPEEKIVWEYGYSFKLAWASFVLCLITGIIDFIVYRNFRKITEEMMLGTVPTPSAKYVTRSSPVNLQSSI